MERRIKFNNVSQYVCVPQYDDGPVPLEICGEMLNNPTRIGIKQDRHFHHEIDDVIDRLQDCNVRNLEYYVCAVCNCRTSVVTRKKSGQQKYSEEEESDDEGLDVQQLLNILHKHRYKTDISHGNKALLQLISSFSGKGVTDGQLNQIIDLLTTDKPSLKEASLMFLHQLCLNEEIATKISKHPILMEIFSILSSPNDASVQIAAFKTVEKLYCYKSISDSLCPHVEECLLPAVLRTFYDKCPMAVKYSAACLLRSLSRHKITSGLLGQELLLILKEFKDSSAKLKNVCIYKEVFTEIIVNLYKHQGLVDAKLLDTNLLPTCSDLISEGPCSSQVMALSLLSGLLDDEQYILLTIKHKHLVPSILNCIQLSDCRKVREAASHLLQLLTRSQNMRIANEFMKQTAIYFLMEEDDGDRALVYPVLLKHQTNEKLWQAMDQLVMLIVNSISKEVEFTKNENRDMMTLCDLSQKSIGLLSHLLHVLYNLCVWPIEKEKVFLPKSDIDDLCEDKELRFSLIRINHQTTLDIWHKGGCKIFTILRTYSQKLQTLLELKSSEAESLLMNNSVTETEYELVENILMILASISVTICHTLNVTDIMKPRKADKPVSEKQIWINNNPYLTGTIDRVSAALKPEDVVKEQQLKEAINQTRKVRKSLYEQNLYSVLSPFLESQNTRIRVLVSVILRCCVQPVDDISELDVNPHPPEKKKEKKTRPQSAVVHSNSHKLELALHGMSPSLESSFRKTLGLRPASASIKSSTARQPLTKKSRQSAVQACGPRLLKGIFSKSRDVKKSCLLLIQDIVKYGTVETHMELSQLGCIPKLVDFLRINEDDEMLEISGLILTRMLISSDLRLKQLFNRHGGARMLMAMTQYTKGKLKEEVKSTLQEVTRGVETSIRPMSAPVSRAAPDVWDHIMGRWKKEDEVVHVLRQWLTDKDKKKTV